MEQTEPTRVYFELPNEFMDMSNKEIDELADEIWLRTIKLLGSK